MYGLLKIDLEWMDKAFKSIEEIDKVIIFGSRAMGNYKKGSDIDIAVFGEDVSFDTIFRLDDLLSEEYPLPYFFDILDYNEINNEKLKKHIDEEGKVIYKKIKNSKGI